MNATTQSSLRVLNRVAIDELGSINEQIKQLEARAKELKDLLANEFGEGATLGVNFIAKIKLAERKTINGANLAKELNAPAEILAKHTKVTAYITVATERVTEVTA
jgi:hypothetical protein